jgi:hypothetical protein
MNNNVVSPSAMKRLAAADAAKVAAILKEPGQGVALYRDSSGNNLLMSYGVYKAQIPHRFPPGSVGEMQLLAYCPPSATSQAEEMISPLLIGVREQQRIPQFPTKWANAPSRTEHPGDRIGVNSILAPLGLEPEPGPMRVEIADERASAPPPPPHAPKRVEPKTGLTSWWSRFDR